MAHKIYQPVVTVGRLAASPSVWKKFRIVASHAKLRAKSASQQARRSAAGSALDASAAELGFRQEQPQGGVRWAKLRLGLKPATGSVLIGVKSDAAGALMNGPTQTPSQLARLLCHTRPF